MSDSPELIDDKLSDQVMAPHNVAQHSKAPPPNIDMVHPSPEQDAHLESSAKKKEKSDQTSTVPTREVYEPLNDDDRNRWEWQSRWNGNAIKHICFDAFYVGIVFFLIILLLIITWRGLTFEWVASGCALCKRSTFDQFVYFFLGGMLGGTLFGIKYLYKVVARGYWHLDRRLWRIFSPFISGGLALAIGTLIDSGMFGLAVKNPTASTYLSLGFISGYFADNALAKMQEIAETIFGTPERRKPKISTQYQNKSADN